MNNEEFRHQKKCARPKCRIDFGTNDPREIYHTKECKNLMNREKAKIINDQIKLYVNQLKENVRIVMSVSVYRKHRINPGIKIEKLGIKLECNSGTKFLPATGINIYYFGDYFAYQRNNLLFFKHKSELMDFIRVNNK